LITDRQRRLYHELSSAEMMVHVQVHVGLLMSLLDSPQPDVLRHRIASAAAEAAGFAAWLWYDLGDLYTMSHCRIEPPDVGGQMGIGFRLATYALSCIEVTARWAVARKLGTYRVPACPDSF
jgi:hypothetical protein